MSRPSVAKSQATSTSVAVAPRWSNHVDASLVRASMHLAWLGAPSQYKHSTIAWQGHCVCACACALADRIIITACLPTCVPLHGTASQHAWLGARNHRRLLAQAQHHGRPYVRVRVRGRHRSSSSMRVCARLVRGARLVHMVQGMCVCKRCNRDACGG